MRTFTQHLEEKSMHVQVLIGMIKAGKFQTTEDLQSFLSSKNYVSKVGQGFWSVAFSGKENPEFILKTSNNAVRGEIDAWFKFAEVAQRNTHNAIYPKVYWHGRLPDGSGVGFVEALYVNPHHADKLAADTGMVPRKQHCFDSLFRYLQSEVRRWAQGDKSASKDVTRVINKIAQAFNCEPKDLLEFVKTWAVSSYTWDVSNDNVGFRKDGAFVIFDAIST